VAGAVIEALLSVEGFNLCRWVKFAQLPTLQRRQRAALRWPPCLWTLGVPFSDKSVPHARGRETPLTQGYVLITLCALRTRGDDG